MARTRSDASPEGAAPGTRFITRVCFAIEKRRRIGSRQSAGSAAVAQAAASAPPSVSSSSWAHPEAEGGPNVRAAASSHATPCRALMDRFMSPP